MDWLTFAQKEGVPAAIALLVILAAIQGVRMILKRGDKDADLIRDELKNTRIRIHYLEQELDECHQREVEMKLAEDELQETDRTVLINMVVSHRQESLYWKQRAKEAESKF